MDMYECELDAMMAARPEDVIPLLLNCRRLLEIARRNGWPTAFVRQTYSPRPFGMPAPHWIEGFKPQRNDMVFERNEASCYSSDAFASSIGAAGGIFAVAGFCSERAALATFIDAARHRHDASLISDASTSHQSGGMAADKAHSGPLSFASQFAAHISTERWIKLMLAPPEDRNAIIR